MVVSASIFILFGISTDLVRSNTATARTNDETASSRPLLVSAPLISCFCSGRNCGEKHYCHGRSCFVGLTAKGDIVKSCSFTAEIVHDQMPIPSCFHDVGMWQEICFCEFRFCNRFRFFRNEFYRYSKYPIKALNSSLKFQLIQTTYDDGMKSDLRYQIVPPPPPNSTYHVYERTNLPVLMVVVPLAIGGMAVILVVLNFYCKMC